MNFKKIKCPCCGQETLDEERMWDVCPVCMWEDDPLQFDDPDRGGGANHFSLNKYRELYLSGKNPFQMEQEYIEGKDTNGKQEEC